MLIDQREIKREGGGWVWGDTCITALLLVKRPLCRTEGLNWVYVLDNMCPYLGAPLPSQPIVVPFLWVVGVLNSHQPYMEVLVYIGYD